MLKSIFPTANDSIPTVIFLNTALAIGALLGVNVFGGIEAARCPKNMRHIANEAPMDNVMVDFCNTNQELHLLSPTRTAANLKTYWYLTRKTFGYEPG